MPSRTCRGSARSPRSPATCTGGSPAARVLGVGDASGHVPDRPGDARLRRRAPALATTDSSRARCRSRFASCCPRCSSRASRAGELTAEGAALLDPTRRPAARRRCSARPRATPAPAWSRPTRSPRAPATSAPARASSRWSCSSVRSQHVHHELDLVTTPPGDPVAMVHCNNGASELAAWVGLFRRFAEAAGQPVDADAVYDALFREALDGEADAGGLLAYNYLAGRADRRTRRGAAAVRAHARTAGFTLANFMRAQLYGVFGTLALGMRVLAEEGVALDRMFAHGGMFRTAGVAQRFLAGALDAPVAVGETASEGGAWGIAVLAAYARSGGGLTLDALSARPRLRRGRTPAVAPRTRRRRRDSPPTSTATAPASPSSAPPSPPSRKGSPQMPSIIPDLKTYEVWFLTGSQGLYGEETLAPGGRAVAARSPGCSADRHPGHASSGSRCSPTAPPSAARSSRPTPTIG